MLLIQDTIVSLEILEKEFCCDLEHCKGCCCIEGDAGAPVTPEEEQQFNALLPELLPHMTKEARAVVDEQGIAYITIPGDESCTLTFKAAIGNEVVTAPLSLTFETDAIYGTPWHPIVINLGETDGIREIGSGKDNESIYDLSGRKIINGNPTNRKLNKGVYIINGQKKTVK